jgi:hypothetical protein
MTEEVVGQERSGAPQPSQGASWQSHFGVRTLTLLLMAEVLVLALAQLPLNLAWGAFAYMDQGANLSVQTLLNRGLVPTVDFGYTYGLLPLLIGRLWFGLLGLTPSAYAAAMLVVDLLIAWGLARCLAAMKVGPAGVVLVVVAMLWAALASYINLAHAIEATLICLALSEHALGRRSRALALLTACLFVKPTMAYIYGFLLVLLIIRDARASGIGGFIRAVAPSAATAFILVLVCGFQFGVKPLVNSLLPLAGAANYRAMNYGFFRGVGRRFWLPDNVWPAYYLVTPAGHYLAGSVILVAAAVAAITRLARDKSGTPTYSDEIIACCGIMQLTFLTTFYADFMSWTYYYYILIIGLAGLAARGPRWAALVLLIAAAALIGQKYQVASIRDQWKTTRPAAEMAGLWVSETEREEWRRVRETIGGGRTSVLANNGLGVTILIPGFDRAENIFLSPGIPLAVDLRRKVDQVAAAEMVLIRDNTTHTSFLDLWPEFRDALDGCELVYSSARYLIYRRLRPPRIPTNARGQTNENGSLSPTHND